MKAEQPKSKVKVSGAVKETSEKVLSDSASTTKGAAKRSPPHDEPHVEEETGKSKPEKDHVSIETPDDTTTNDKDEMLSATEESSKQARIQRESTLDDQSGEQEKVQQKQPKKIAEPENLDLIRKKQQEVDDVLFDLIDRIDDFMEAYGDGKAFPPHGTGMQTNQGEDTKPPTRKRNKKNPIQAVARGIGGFWKGVRTLPRKLRKKKPEKS